jgi:hypothetical protein
VAVRASADAWRSDAWLRVLPEARPPDMDIQTGAESQFRAWPACLLPRRSLRGLNPPVIQTC